MAAANEEKGVPSTGPDGESGPEIRGAKGLPNPVDSDSSPGKLAGPTPHQAVASLGHAHSTWPWRIAILSIGVVPLCLLGIAGFLTPSAEGLGTHQQLGLPPCSMRVLFGIRCPGCGMTTSWSHFARGQWISSFQSNIGGFLLAGLSVGFAPIAVRSGWTGRMPTPTVQWWATWVVLAIAAVTITQWISRVWL